MKKAALFSIAFLFFAPPVFTQDLPLTVTRPKHFTDDAPCAFLISGDGGWYKFEQAIADTLAGYGIPTIGLDIKKYFHEKRTPESMTADVVRTLEHFEPVFGKDHFLFIGYSLGAEILPFIISRLPGKIKDRVSMYVLLSPAATTDFSIHIADLMGMQSRYDTYRVIDEIKKNTGVPSLCIFGSEEKTNVPVMLRNTGTSIALIPGDHHYGHDAPLIVRTMKNHKAF
ncbi:MAG TPA: AcvB/VirJ family lysyl-phosphatidylglycerol hydrolase [Bacteroidales bacterium]|nr:AcvB/VirJ family lysyl-phosphatidylglycerol hydrolase [Bacteroidales bacterium]